MKKRKVHIVSNTTLPGIDCEAVSLREVFEKAIPVTEQTVLGAEDSAIYGHAEGAWARGTRVKKIRSAPGDFHQDGALGTICGSVGPLREIYGYFVRWDDLLPHMPAVFTTSTRLERVKA
jgi:hypothetical protein